MIFDAVVLLIILISTVFAFFRGFIRETLTVLGVVGGVLAALYMGPQLSPLVSGWIGADVPEGEDVPRLFGLVPYPILADILSYGVIFLVFVIVLSVLSHFLAGWARTIGLGVFDKILGILFGALRAAVLIALLYLPVFQLTDPEQRDEWFPSSNSRPYVEAMTAWTLQFLPQASEEDIESAKENAGKAVSTVGQKLRDLTDGAEKQDNNETNGTNGTKEKNGNDVTSGESGTEGYQDEQRESLDRLFEENIDE